jgi:hypothetical protein
MTIGTEEADVLEPVVLTYAIAVVKLHVEGLAVPFCEAAALASVLLQPSGDQALLEMTPVRLRPVCDEQFFKRHAMGRATTFPRCLA